MSSNLAYIAYEAMTSGISSISLYILDSNNNRHSVNVVIVEPNTVVYADSSTAGYTAVSFNLAVNGNTIVSIPLNNISKSSNEELVIVLSLQLSINLPGQLSQLIAQAVQAIFAGLKLNLGCSATAYYTIYNSNTGSSSSGSTGMSFSLVNDNQFNASASISYSQGQTVYVTDIVIQCSYGNVKQSILSGTLQSSQCTSSNGCTYTVTVTFTS